MQQIYSRKESDPTLPGDYRHELFLGYYYVENPSRKGGPRRLWYLFTDIPKLIPPGKELSGVYRHLVAKRKESCTK